MHVLKQPSVYFVNGLSVLGELAQAQHAGMRKHTGMQQHAGGLSDTHTPQHTCCLHKKLPPFCVMTLDLVAQGPETGRC